MLTVSPEILLLPRIDAELVMNYIQELGTVSPNIEERIVEVNDK